MRGVPTSDKTRSSFVDLAFLVVVLLRVVAKAFNC